MRIFGKTFKIWACPLHFGQLKKIMKTAVVKETMKYREKLGVIRKVFFQLLVQWRNTGTVPVDD